MTKGALSPPLLRPSDNTIELIGVTSPREQAVVLTLADLGERVNILWD